MESAEVQTNDPIPDDIMRKFFPDIIFKGKQVIIHHDGAFPPDLLQAIDNRANQLKAKFFAVEILRQDIPRLYALERGVTQPPWGTLFYLSDKEAFVVSSVPSDDSTPQPLHVRVAQCNIPIDQAVYSVLAWTLLHYGALGLPKLPVTIQHAEDLAQWLSLGMLPDKTEGDVPFWL
jgi:argonaute-like protein implicated in RNA metabolism and viral defense